MALVCSDLVHFGTAPMLIYEDPEKIINCYVPMIGEYFIGQGSAQRPDTIYRTFTMTIKQIVERFKLQNCPKELQALWESKGMQLEQERIVAHCVEPNYPFRDPDGAADYGAIPGDFTYREFYWVWGIPGEYPLSARGFHELPFICPRWSVSGNDPYGWGPGSFVLPDVIQLQVETRAKGEFLQKMIKPPLIAPKDLRNQPTSLIPGGMSFSDSQVGMRPVFELHPQGFEAINTDIAQLQMRIKQGFFNDLFLMAAQSEKDETAFEVAAKQQEKMQTLGPVVERIQVEAASAAVTRVLSIARRRGIIRPPPDSLRGVQLDLKFVSTLALAQRAAQTTATERLLQMLGHIAGIRPEVLDNYDFDTMVRDYGSDLGVPSRYKNPLNKVQQIRAQHAQAAQQAQKAAQASQIAQHAPDVTNAAKNLSETDLGGGQNALQMMFNPTNRAA
jgi:hypothetical protein